MREGPSKTRRGGWRRRLLIAWLALLVVSYLVSALRRGAEPELAPGEAVAQVFVVEDGALGEREVPLVYRDLRPSGSAEAAAVVLLHGSPGSAHDFDSLTEFLGDRYRLIVPDLPGFGQSRAPVPDYSVAAHARYVLQLLDALEVEEAHLVGFSMGGGVAVELAHATPERVRSMVLLAAIGVQELELFGDYRMNHMVHGLQLAFLQLVRFGVPHFGAMESAFLGVPYARNFYDTDQRPLRGMLERYAGPLLVLHGETDFLVPPAAAHEHHRIAPQSELEMMAEGGHFILWLNTEEVAEVLDGFFARVESGQAAWRADAEPERLALAAAPFDSSAAPPAAGPALLILMLLIIAATLISEDLTCIGAGLLVAQGRIEFVPAFVACFTGIFFGDLLLFLAGRWFGRPALDHAPLRWVVNEDRLDRASEWFRKRGVIAILLTRLLPGLRLPVYFAAGLLRTRFWVFALYFFLAGAVWTPLLVGITAWIGFELDEAIDLFERFSLPVFLVLVLVLLFLERIGLRLLTHRGRRRLIGAWRGWTRWEFWPPWLFYAPVAVYLGQLALRHRSLTLVTAVNPAIPTGGFIGESKAAILDGLARAGERVARYRLLPAEMTAAGKLAATRAFLEEHGLALPLVVKPDVGQRGSGVRICEDEAQLTAALAVEHLDLMVQEYVEGREFGIFYYRLPGEERGRTFSVTEKRLPTVTGDGERNLERLILDDERAVIMADAYFHYHSDHLLEVPPAGEEVQLVRIGTHCRGAVFLDGSWVNTPVLEDEIERISRTYEGFYFGRYDVRCESIEALREGRGFKVLELNGLTSEATHIYDPKTRLRDAYRVLFEQWRLAFDIAHRNHQRGARTAPVEELWRELKAYRRLKAAHLG